MTAPDVAAIARKVLAGAAFMLACWIVTIAIAVAVMATVDALTVPPEVRTYLQENPDA